MYREPRVAVQSELGEFERRPLVGDAARETGQVGEPEDVKSRRQLACTGPVNSRAVFG